MSGVATAVIPLPARMRLTLEHAADGHTAAEIGVLMNVTENTVIRQLELARALLSARNTTHAVAIAMRNGYLL